jgi:hypothetical protein
MWIWQAADDMNLEVWKATETDQEWSIRRFLVISISLV